MIHLVNWIEPKLGTRDFSYNFSLSTVVKVTTGVSFFEDKNISIYVSSVMYLFIRAPKKYDFLTQGKVLSYLR